MNVKHERRLPVSHDLMGEFCRIIATTVNRFNPSWPTLVMAGLSRSKNGVASLAYVPAIHVFLAVRP